LFVAQFAGALGFCWLYGSCAQIGSTPPSDNVKLMQAYPRVVQQVVLSVQVVGEVPQVCWQVPPWQEKLLQQSESSVQVAPAVAAQGFEPRSWQKSLTQMPQQGFTATPVPASPQKVDDGEQVFDTVAGAAHFPDGPGAPKAPVGSHTRFAAQSVAVSQGSPASATGQPPALVPVEVPVVGLVTQKLLLPQTKPGQQSRLSGRVLRPQGPAPTWL
jgi:hypothetical protein